MNVKELQERLRDFARERDWEQFHTPKNLVMALAGEVGELLELFQWLTPEQRPEYIRLYEEIGDIGIYLLQICDKLGVNLDRAIKFKIEVNGRKYPIEKSRGNAQKYNSGQED